MSDEIPTDCPTLFVLHCVCCPKHGLWRESRVWVEAEKKMPTNWQCFADDTVKPT